MKTETTTKNAESEESGVGQKRALSTISPLSSTEENKLVWPPPGIPKKTGGVLLRQVRNFYPLSSLEFVIRAFADLEDYREDFDIEDWLKLAMTYLSSNEPNWQLRYQHFFNSRYPKIEREVWSNGRICHKGYPKIRPSVGDQHTFITSILTPIRAPRNELGSRIAPSLYDVKLNKDGTFSPVPTPEAQRFLNGEILAVPKSSLTEVVHYNRPTWQVKSEWKIFSDDQLPKRIETAKIISTYKDNKLLEDFIDDLKITFSWENHEQLPKYLGMLIQPMIAHLAPGQNPAYAILGPTKSGKGYLSSALPALIYSRAGDPTTQVKKMPNSTYEMEVFLGSCKEALFVCLDEIKNASDEEFKMIDAMCTQEVLQARIMRQGYYEIPNLITICMTAVHQSFTDETYGRLAVIKLSESRSDAVAEFHNRWKSHGPQLLNLLFRKISDIKFDPLNVERVPDRRPGFSIIAHFVEQAFGTRPSYAIDSTTSDVLDDLCKMYEQVSNLGLMKGSWRRYTPANFVDFMSSQYDRKWKRSSAASAINTSLGYKSTKNHPNYKETGYQAESGKFYHFETRDEGQKTKRTYIYIQEVSYVKS